MTCCVQDIEPFHKPKIELEQYPTGPHLAARMLYTVRVHLLYIYIYIYIFVYDNTSEV